MNFRLRCDTCGSSRSLRSALSPQGLGPCSGGRPWLISGDDDGCTETLMGALRNASNVYFPTVVASVYVPRDGQEPPEDLLRLLEAGPTRMLIDFKSDEPIPALARLLVENDAAGVGRYGVPVVEVALKRVREGHANESIVVDEVDYRKAEFDVFVSGVNSDHLRVASLPVSDYAFAHGAGLESISLVTDLVVTKVLAGFGRVLPKVSTDASRRDDALFWKNPPDAKRRWLPGVQVRGEGIFFRLDEDLVQAWEERPAVKNRIAQLVAEAEASRFAPRSVGSFTARLILVHTLAHLVIQRLVYDAGYSAASLSERLYAREAGGGQEPMAGFLVYTASGDADGSLGGLVRLGLPGQLEPVLGAAVDAARWCSSDPVCMELGGSERQGPDGLNLAACHACAHVPETTCECFNVLLDRALVVGSLEDASVGYFTGLRTVSERRG